MHVDYIITGQGICGTFLSYYLLKEGKKIIVIDDAKPFAASRIASGVINPVTGRRIVKTWLIDELMPFAWKAYKEMSDELKVSLIEQCNVLDFHPSQQMQQAFLQRLDEENNYLESNTDDEKWKGHFRFNYGVGEINPCWLVDVQLLLQLWRKKLLAENLLLEENFSYDDCKVEKDEVVYKDTTAGKIIFCEGATGINNPWFKMLPFALNKGEAVIAEIPGLPRNNIYKQGISIVPWQNELFWIGSSYEWGYKDTMPSPAFKKRLEAQLHYWLKLPYKILDHFATERPANIDRRPFTGLHPHHPCMGILNGMGTKGCSLAPYFAHQLTAHLLDDASINPLADVKRFAGVLGRV